MPLAGIKLLEVCFSIHKGCFISDSSFVVKLALIVMLKKTTPKCLYTLKDGSAASFVNVRNLGGHCFS